MTKLVIRHIHEKVQHQGRGITHSEIRLSGFWIVGGSSVVSDYISKCVQCRKMRGALQVQKMSDLPEDRLEPSPPFTYSCVDYFGPFIDKEGRKELKRWIALFTCMSSRAVHLEVANSLDTDSFLNAYRRFIGRRGPVRQIRCDQGTNFVGAKNELSQALNELDHDKIQRELMKNNCDCLIFKLNVPQASHMGGVWERQIRTARSILANMLTEHGGILSDESLRTFIVEVENIVNSRPLDSLNSEECPDPLTPNHLLTGKFNVVLPPPGCFQRADIYLKKHWRRVQHLTNEFWSRWRKGYLSTLQERQKWNKPQRNLKVNDIVIVKDENLPRNCWQLARVVDSFVDPDGLVRKVKLLVADKNSAGNKGRHSTLERPIHKLVLLVPYDD